MPSSPRTTAGRVPGALLLPVQRHPAKPTATIRVQYTFAAEPRTSRLDPAGWPRRLVPPAAARQPIPRHARHHTGWPPPRRLCCTIRATGVRRYPGSTARCCCASWYTLSYRGRTYYQGCRHSSRGGRAPTAPGYSARCTGAGTKRNAI